MEELPGALDAGTRLRRADLRDFRAPVDEGSGELYKLLVRREDAPVPALWRHALTLIGMRHEGPAEKVAWWIAFSYMGDNFTLAHERFAVRLYLRTELSESKAQQRLEEVATKIRSAVRTVERLIVAAAPELLGSGSATVVNQHFRLQAAYEYFRDRAQNPVRLEDALPPREEGDVHLWADRFNLGLQTRNNSFHDMVAAITAYLSLMEHNLVLALPFADFDPNKDDLTQMIGTKWGEKWRRVLGTAGDAPRYRQRLATVVERWRNPYSHGGFEKGLAATIWLHVPEVGAVPIGMSDIRNSPHFSLVPADETDIATTFSLFDELDEWMRRELPEAAAWWESGLDARFDADFRGKLDRARKRGRFEAFLDKYGLEHDRAVNMDF